MRSSTFAASETLHQLAWVVGGLAGLLMSLTNSGVAGLAVAASGLGLALTCCYCAGGAGSWMAGATWHGRRCPGRRASPARPVGAATARP